MSDYFRIIIPLNYRFEMVVTYGTYLEISTNHINQQPFSLPIKIRNSECHHLAELYSRSFESSSGGYGPTRTRNREAGRRNALARSRCSSVRAGVRGPVHDPGPTVRESAKAREREPARSRHPRTRFPKTRPLGAMHPKNCVTRRGRRAEQCA